MDLSFVILSWNSKDHLECCLASIEKQLPDHDWQYEIFVVDNGSTDGSAQWLKEQEKHKPNVVKPIYLDHNTGTTYSRNRALKLCKGEYIIVLDSDVELHSETIPALKTVIESEDGVGMVVPKLLYGSGQLQKSTDEFPTLIRKLERLFFLKSIEDREAAAVPVNDNVYVDYAISAFWMFSKQVLDEVGLLDEKIFYAPEDVDYCIRVWKSGFKILYVPREVATHHAQEISRGFKLNKAKIEHVKGLIYYFIKHRYFLRKPSLSSFSNTGS